ncbi:MAG TPA: hypothetical protein VJG67_03015 [Candidatus Paceibacterota bacterium]
MSIRKTEPVWHSPLNIYWWEDKLAQKIGKEIIKKRSKYQKVREARIAAIVALAMYKIRDIPAYVQIPREDPPDAYILQESKKIKGQADISTIEITTYYDDSRETLLEQLKRKKVPETHKTYSDEYILVVEIGVRNPPINIDYDELRSYLNEIDVKFPIWTVRDISHSGDTIAEVVTVNPETQTLEINVGEAAYTFKTHKLPDVQFVKQGTSKNAGKRELAGEYRKPPWDESLLGD